MYERIPEIMTLKECQQILKVGKNTMLELLHTNQIDGFKIGGRWKIPKESVVEFIRYREGRIQKVLTRRAKSCIITSGVLNIGNPT